jgi:hypothetical protein
MTNAGGSNSIHFKNMPKVILPCLLMNTKSAWLSLNHLVEKNASVQHQHLYGTVHCQHHI